MLLGTFVDEVWWPACAKLRECTRVGYESSYRCHIRSRWGGVEVQTAGNAIALRSSEKMTIGKGGWVEGCITVPLA